MRRVEASIFVPGKPLPRPLCYFLPSWVLQWVSLCPESTSLYGEGGAIKMWQ